MATVVRWSVYLLRCRDGSLYCGVTTDVTRRLAAHAAGRGARYTRGRAPLELVHVERARGRSDALKREAAWKRLTREQKLRRLAQLQHPVSRRRVRQTPAGRYWPSRKATSAEAPSK